MTKPCDSFNTKKKSSCCIFFFCPGTVSKYQKANPKISRCNLFHCLYVKIEILQVDNTWDYVWEEEPGREALNVGQWLFFFPLTVAYLILVATNLYFLSPSYSHYKLYFMPAFRTDPTCPPAPGRSLENKENKKVTNDGPSSRTNSLDILCYTSTEVEIIT